MQSNQNYYNPSNNKLLKAANVVEDVLATCIVSTALNVTMPIIATYMLLNLPNPNLVPPVLSVPSNLLFAYKDNQPTVAELANMAQYTR